MLGRLSTCGCHCEEALSSKKLDQGGFIRVGRCSSALLTLLGGCCKQLWDAALCGTKPWHLRAIPGRGLYPKREGSGGKKEWRGCPWEPFQGCEVCRDRGSEQEPCEDGQALGGGRQSRTVLISSTPASVGNAGAKMGGERGQGLSLQG